MPIWLIFSLPFSATWLTAKLSPVQHFTTIADYCAGIGISLPKWQEFDIRSFRENMGSVRHRMLPFRHEFYAIALKLEGGGSARTGNFSTADLQATVFFNSPYQILSWDIAPDWEGYYIIFSEAFYRQPHHYRRITERFPFLLIDNAIPFPVDQEEARLFLRTFEDIYAEHRSSTLHSVFIIRHSVDILLHKVDRLFRNKAPQRAVSYQQRRLDLDLVSRFKTLLELSFQPGQTYEAETPHQVQFYARRLSLHPNHLNAVIKRITERSASEHIKQHVLTLSTSLLANTSLSVKEIAFQLYYDYPNHFSNFFKKQSGQTPGQYRRR